MYASSITLRLAKNPIKTAVRRDVRCKKIMSDNKSFVQYGNRMVIINPTFFPIYTMQNN